MPFIEKIEFEPEKICRDKQHNAPGHSVLKPGVYTWQCPTCKKKQTFIVPNKPRM